MTGQEDNSKICTLDSILEEKRRLENACNEIYIVNAGRMNHGKSSLFNSLLNKEAFQVQDVRTTTRNQREQYCENVYLVDTPGLCAEQMDDEEAFRIYQQANFIFFVHNPNVGELHRQEIDHIQKIADGLGKDYFWKHMAIVLTFLESNKDSMDTVRNQIEATLKETFQVEQVPFFEVSNSRYQSSINEENPKRQQTFFQQSGIPALQAFIQQHIPVWQQENLQVQTNRFQGMKIREIAFLTEHKVRLQHTIHQQQAVMEEQCEQVKSAFEQAISQTTGYRSSLKEAKQHLKKLKHKHEQEHF